MREAVKNVITGHERKRKHVQSGKQVERNIMKGMDTA